MTVTPTPPTPDEADRIFSGLDDRNKVDFVERERAALIDGLDRIIAEMSAVKVRAEDPDGIVKLTLGYDSRLQRLSINDGATVDLSVTTIQDKINETMADAQEEVALMRSEIKDTAIDHMPQISDFWPPPTA
ncbi:YbaB/EbfC family nucleoid-associated protein [Mycobacteroides salmoniphilum]|uniref:YbaB/EbfC family nucleoid-associated protein n=1 Tax=Mycobacteroides salmoniphilum TaxID=404941 RepID=UPI003565185B